MTVKQIIVIRKDLNMRKGKIAAQASHASMKFLLDGAIWGIPFHYNKSERPTKIYEDGVEVRKVVSEKEREWLQGLFTKIVAYVTSEQELTDLMVKGKAAGLQVYPIVDSGLTEFNGIPTLTCAAFGPDTPEKLDPVTGKLPLL